MNELPVFRAVGNLRRGRRLWAGASLAVPLLLLLSAPGPARAQLPAPNFVYETDRELVSSGDFDGDGKPDLVIVDKESGKTRLGYALDAGIYNWAPWRPAGTKFVSGLAIGRLVATNRDALAFAAADANKVTLLDAANQQAPASAVLVPVQTLGPNAPVAVALGGAGRTPLQDLYLASMYNADPTPNLELLLRNTDGQFTKQVENPLPGTASHANRVALKAGGPEVVAELLTGDAGTGFRLEDLSSGQASVVASVTNLPSGADYVVGRFGGAAWSQFLFYKPGDATVQVRPVEEKPGGGFQLGAGQSFTLPQPIKQLAVIPAGQDEKLLAVLGEGATATVFSFDGQSAPVSFKTFNPPTNEVIFSVAVMPNGFMLLTAPPTGRASSRYQGYAFDGQQYAAGIFGGLASLADTDDMVVPDIYTNILAHLTVTNAADMKPYTNTIPGTTVTYAMVPIPGGEFLMGSATSTNADELPQHKVKISPFWMEQCELTWNEYELFMFPDDEKRLREQFPTGANVDKISDAVTRPSKPYVEMSFGMGKDRYPAIAMTQHGANKYCQWLSAKTGHFYRLPTEAEWEYACRAGTTTDYSFGNDATKLGDYAWFFDNSDSKYQRVGRKKPNPWGLYDMHGNVIEWCLDQYDPDFYKECAAKGEVVDPWNRATKAYPHSVRGGSWDDDPPAQRSAARRGSDRSWKMTDPQLPKSIWYLSDSRVVGFRLVRPLKVPPPEEMVKYWTSGVERD